MLQDSRRNGSRASAAKPEAPVRGNMRITAPVVFGSTRLGPLVVDFLGQHPELSLNVELSDRSVDLIEEGYDLAIRTSPTASAGLVAWPLMPLDYMLSAAPSYLLRHGTPAVPGDLTTHHCITGTDTGGTSWRFDGPDGQTEVSIFGRLQVNNAMLRCDVARAGAGVLLCAEYLVENDLATGRLVRLLPDHKPASSTLHAVSPAYRANSPKVRSLVSHLTAQLNENE
jgi:DNA-binding transcriptional LysR family regulator